ncbi:MAG TPA: radical SAM protein [Bacillales bacterium]|nr:radical SAM protein [Bacillales bacterium]
MGTPTYEDLTAKQTLNRVKDTHMPFDWSINPYRGCFHGCSFCYARATHSFLGMEADDSFQSHIFVKRNAAVAMKIQLANLMRKFHGNRNAVARRVGLVAIGTATDPYQPIEGKAKLTRQCLEVLSGYGIPVTITTRSPLVLRDLDLLEKMNIVSVNISISTLNRKVCRGLEPAAPYPVRRLEIVRKLMEHNVPSGIFMAPILPCLSDSAADMEELICAAKENEALFVSPSVLRLAPEVKEWFFHMLKDHYPQLLSAYMGLYQGAYPNAAYVATLMNRVNRLLDRYGFTGQGLDLSYQRAAKRDQSKSQGEQLSFSF